MDNNKEEFNNNNSINWKELELGSPSTNRSMGKAKIIKLFTPYELNGTLRAEIKKLTGTLKFEFYSW